MRGWWWKGPVAAVVVAWWLDFILHALEMAQKPVFWLTLVVVAGVPAAIFAKPRLRPSLRHYSAISC